VNNLHIEFNNLSASARNKYHLETEALFTAKNKKTTMVCGICYVFLVT
jgi:hypothetical protein